MDWDRISLARTASRRMPTALDRHLSASCRPSGVSGAACAQLNQECGRVDIGRRVSRPGCGELPGRGDGVGKTSSVDQGQGQHALIFRQHPAGPYRNRDGSGGPV